MELKNNTYIVSIGYVYIKIILSNSMDSKKELYDFITENLRELAWYKDLPLHPKIMVQGFLYAMRKTGYEMKRKRQSVGTTITIQYPHRSKTLEASLTKDELLSCWNHYPRGAPKTLYNAVYELCDRLRKGMNPDESDRFFKRGDPITFRDHFDDYLEEQFALYHENMYIGIDGKIPELRHPELFYEVFSGFPLGIYENSKFIDKQGHTAEVEGKILPFRAIPSVMDVFTGDWVPNIDEGYYPTESTMLDYFWGLYLAKFSKIKGYPLAYPDDAIYSFFEYGWDSIQNSQLWDKPKFTLSQS